MEAGNPPSTPDDHLLPTVPFKDGSQGGGFPQWRLWTESLPEESSLQISGEIFSETECTVKKCLFQQHGMNTPWSNSYWLFVTERCPSRCEWAMAATYWEMGQALHLQGWEFWVSPQQLPVHHRVPGMEIIMPPWLAGQGLPSGSPD